MSNFEVAVVGGITVVLFGTVFGALSLPLVSRTCHAWVWLLTLGLPESVQTRRRCEFEADVHDECTHLGGLGYSPGEISVHMLTRLIVGIPGDVTWRVSSIHADPVLYALLVVTATPVGIVAISGGSTLIVTRALVAAFAIALSAGILMIGWGWESGRPYAKVPGGNGVDRILLFACLGTWLIGGYFLWRSATETLVLNHLAFAFVGWLGLWAVATVDYRRWHSLCVPVLGAALGALLILLALGDAHEIQRSLNLGLFTIEPTEFAKLAVILYCGAWLASRGPDIRSFSLGFVPFALLLSILMGLVVAQPDTGGAAVLVIATAVLMYVSKAPLTHLAVLLVAGGLISYMVIQERGLIGATLGADTEAGPRYSQMIAEAGLAGGSSGGEWASSGQHDGAFAVVAGEAGILGIVVVMCLYALVVYRGIVVSWRARDTFGHIIGMGLTGWIGAQVVLNMGGVVGFLPITGEGLPLISYGFSDLFAFMLAVGLLLSISRSHAPQRVNSAAGGVLSMPQFL